VQRWMRRHSELARRLERLDDPLAELPQSTASHLLSQQVVLVGYGRVGERIAQQLTTQGVPYVVAEINRKRVDDLRKAGVPAVCGDAQTPEVLVQAHIARAAMLVVTVPDSVNVRKMVEISRTLNPGVQITLCTHNTEEAALLQAEAQCTVFLAEQTLATGMAEHVVRQLKRS
jgi:CPA2 family monovalent cation:H+ antiporter-2